MGGTWVKTTRRKLRDLSGHEKAEAKAMLANGTATLSEVAALYNVLPQGLEVGLGLRFPLRFKEQQTKGMPKPRSNGHSNGHAPSDEAVVPELTADFFNWMAKELVRAREALARSEEMLRNYQQVKVSNELATIYREYTRR